MTTVSALISRFQQTVSFGTFNFNVKIKTLFNSIELVRSPKLNGQYFAKKIGSSHLTVKENNSGRVNSTVDFCKTSGH